MKDKESKVEQRNDKSARPAREPRERENLDEPFERIYNRYGADLPAFFRDAYREALEKRCDSSVEVEFRSQ